MILEVFEQITNSLTSRVSWLMQGNPPDVTVRINSQGGDVFAALSAFNLLKGKCDVQVLGLCASAATIIACAGKKVSAARNALFCFHNPKTLLIDYYDKPALEKLTATLGKTEESILAAYRTKVADFQMPAEELWLSAAEAQSLGFVDELIDEVPIEMNAGKTFINSIAYDAAQVKGLSERLHPTPRTDAALVQILNLIKDQMNSGSAGVQNQTLTVEDMKALQLQKMINYANGVV